MSVFIKGMKMPKNCFSCQLKEAGFCVFTNELVNELVVDIYRNSDCPLVELPENHGRLIDADLLKNEYPHDTDWDYPVNTNHYVCESIDSAPTVIEAEGEE